MGTIVLLDWAAQGVAAEGCRPLDRPEGKAGGMTIEKYRDIRFRQSSLSLLNTVNETLAMYAAQDLTLTVRTIYYQLVTKNIIENTKGQYLRICNLLRDARLAGLIDWDMIVDQTRAFQRITRWDSTTELILAVPDYFHMDLWIGQESRVFVVVEKDALSGILRRTCREYDVPLLAARGYSSTSILREFTVEDLIPTIEAGQVPVVLHLGDHDPSGLDMTRDLEERTKEFARDLGDAVLVIRLALNMEQVIELKPPPNFAKETDKRFKEYEKKYGKDCWELDALPPDYMVRLVKDAIKKYIDRQDLFDKRLDLVKSGKAELSKFVKRFTG